MCTEPGGSASSGYLSAIAVAGEHSEWKEREPFKSALAGDMAGVAATGEKGMLEIVAAAHSGMTVEQFSKTVENWVAIAWDTRF